jgi:hypothetical protein
METPIYIIEKFTKQSHYKKQNKNKNKNKAKIILKAR